MRRKSLLWGGAAAAAVLLGSLFTAPVATAAGTTRVRRTVADAPTIHVPTTAEAEAHSASLITQARSEGTTPQIPVGHTGYTAVFLSDVNGYGTAVGWGAKPGVPSSTADLVLMHNGTTEVIGRTTGPTPYGDRNALGTAINDDGIVTGVAACYCANTQPGVAVDIPFRWSRADGFSYAPMPAGVWSATGVAINDEGVILINSYGAPSADDDGAFLWDPNVGTLEKLPDMGGGPAVGMALNNDGTVVGYAPVPGVPRSGRGVSRVVRGGNQAVRWGWGRQHRITDLAPGPLESQALDINQDGTIVGWQGTSFSQTRAMAWLGNGRRSRDLGEGKAVSINDDDQVAGNIVLAHVVPDDTGNPIEVTLAAVYDLWDTAHRVMVDTGNYQYAAGGFGQDAHLNDDGLVVTGQLLFGPAVVP